MDAVHNFITIHFPTGCLTELGYTIVKKGSFSFLKNNGLHVFQHIPKITCYGFSFTPLVIGSLISLISDYAIDKISGLEIELNDPHTVTKDNMTVMIYNNGYYKDTKYEIFKKLFGQWSITCISSLIVISTVSLIFASTLAIGSIFISSMYVGTFVFVAKKVCDYFHHKIKDISSYPYVVIKNPVN